MKIKIQFSTQAAKTVVSISEKIAGRFMEEVVKNINSLSKQELSKNLADKFVGAIKVNTLKTRINLTLDSGLANMIEEGHGPYDMKPFFAKSSKVKYSKNGGWYLVIPMGFTTKRGQSNSLPMAVIKAIKEAKRKKAPIKIPKRYSNPRTNKTTGYTHKFSIYQGLKKSSGSKRGSYSTFRIVSSKSPAGSWVHPGFRAHNFIDRAIDQVDINKVINSI